MGEKQLLRKFCITVLPSNPLYPLRHVRHEYSQIWSKQVITSTRHIVLQHNPVLGTAVIKLTIACGSLVGRKKFSWLLEAKFLLNNYSCTIKYK